MCPHNRETCPIGRAMPSHSDHGVSSLALPASSPRAPQDVAAHRPPGMHPVNALAALTPLIHQSASPSGYEMAETYQNMDCAEDRDEEEDDEQQKENIVSWPQISW